jgi:hypothetical protein
LSYSQHEIDKLIKLLKEGKRVKKIYCSWAFCKHNNATDDDVRGVCQCIEDVILEVDPETDQLKCLSFEYGRRIENG